MRLRLKRHGPLLGVRDRRLSMGLGAVLVAACLFKGVWQPAQQRLQHAERLYQQRLLLAVQVQRARPGQAPSGEQPLSRRLSDSAAVAGLEWLQMDKDAQGLRLTLAGQAEAVLGWLIRAEREGAQMQTLTLERQDERLLVSVAWRDEGPPD